jgi:hypothetical protein
LCSSSIAAYATAIAYFAQRGIVSSALAYPGKGESSDVKFHWLIFVVGFVAAGATPSDGRPEAD